MSAMEASSNAIVVSTTFVVLEALLSFLCSISSSYALTRSLTMEYGKIPLGKVIMSAQKWWCILLLCCMCTNQCNYSSIMDLGSIGRSSGFVLRILVAISTGLVVALV